MGTIAKWDPQSNPLGNVVINVTDSTFTTGGAGLYAETFATYQYAHIYAPCPADANGCIPGMDEDQCVMVCRQGMNVVSGSQSMTCNAKLNATTGELVPAWDGTPPVCAVARVTFRVFVAQCPELQAMDTPCGDPLGGEVFSVADVINYAIVGGNNFSAFYIDSCSGQLHVNNQSATSLKLFPAGFTLSIQATIVGSDPAATGDIQSVQVLFTRNLDAPVLPDPQTLVLFENPKPGAAIGQLLASNVEPGPGYEAIVWKLDSVLDGAERDFTLNASGFLSVSSRPSASLPVPLDFEGPPGTFTLFVHASRASNPALQAEAVVLVVLQDANDAPTVDPVQVFSVQESQLTPNSVFGPSFRVLDADTSPAFDSSNSASGPTAVFSVVPPSLWPLTGGPCARNLVPAANVPTVDGSWAGASLFTISPTGDGLALANALPPSALTPVVSYGVLAKASYLVCVSSTSAGVGPPPGSGVGPTAVLQLVPAIIEADLPRPSMVTGCTLSDAAITYGGGAHNTTGGDSITCAFTGSFTGPVTATYSNGLATFSTSCTQPDGTTLVCPVKPGCGASLVWAFADSLGGVAVSTPFITHYKPPALRSALNYTTLFPNGPGHYPGDTHTSPLTEGGDILVLSGANFGPGTSAGCPVSITFAPPIVFGSTQPAQAPYVCAYTPPGPLSYSSDTRVQCTIPPGAGAGLVVSLSVGGQHFLPAVAGAAGPVIRYQSPVITAVYNNAPGFNATYPGTSALNPSGGDTLVLLGEAFGPGLRPSEYAVASFGGTNGKLFEFTKCTHDSASPSTKLVCVTPPAQGTGLRLSVNVASIDSGLSAAAVSISFVGPTITGVSGPGTVAASTSGGQLIRIIGVRFPPAKKNLVISLAYGPLATATRFTASQCTVTQELPLTPTIQCLSAPGTGVMTSFVLTVSGSSSPIFIATGASYAHPVVDSLAGAAVLLGASSSAPTQLIVNGQNFGPADAYTNSVTEVWYQLPGAAAGSTPFSYRATGCTVTIAFTQITCNTALGVGAGLAVNVVVNALRSTTQTLSYAAPTISGIYIGQLALGTNFSAAQSAAGVALGDPNNQYAITVVGSGFGPPTRRASRARRACRRASASSRARSAAPPRTRSARTRRP